MVVRAPGRWIPPGQAGRGRQVPIAAGAEIRKKLLPPVCPQAMLSQAAVDMRAPIFPIILRLYDNQLSELIRAEPQCSLTLPPWLERLTSIGIATTSPEDSRGDKGSTSRLFVVVGANACVSKNNSMSMG